MRIVLLILLAVLEAGCASMPAPAPVAHPNQVWQQRRATLSRIAYWHLRGRMAVTNGDDAWDIDVDWLQRGDKYRIQLNGPFGAGKVRLIGNADGVELQNSDHQTFYADNPSTLLREQTGVAMPVEGLRYWILGLSTPQQQTPPKLDSQGRLAYLQDHEWRVKFRRYTEVDGIQLPDKIFIARPERKIDVRLIVDQWQLGLSD